MAQVSFDAVPESATNGGGQFNSVDFFNLRNDGDEAIVRIMHDSTESFNIFAVHDRVSVGGKTRKVNCIRENAKAPIDNCPLCASGSPLAYRIFINMVQYTVNQQGVMESKPVVWERGFNYATRLKSLIEQYGPLSDCVMKIKRNGAAGSQDTTYEILYCPPKMYPDENYPKDEKAFESYSALGSIILNKNYAELNQFVQTGTFPAAPANNANAQPPAADAYQPKTETVAPPAAAPAYAPTAAPAPQDLPWVAPNSAPTVTTPPPVNPSTAVPGNPGRPTSRYY